MNRKPYGYKENPSSWNVFYSYGSIPGVRSSAYIQFHVP